METLIHRNCPGCGSDQPILLFKLRFDQLVTVNPTHNIAWFDSLGFAGDEKFKFVKCNNCDFVYSDTRLNDILSDQFYHTGIDSQKSLKKNFSINKKLKQILIWYNLLYTFSLHCNPDYDLSERKIKVLDFGAGWGDFLATVKSPGIEVFGSEFDRNKIKFACTNGISVGNFDFIKNHAPYDIFCCNQVLEHVDKPKECLWQLKGLLKKNSVGFISVPNFSPRRMDRFIKDIKQGKSAIKEINPWGHLNYFTPLSLRQMLHESEFSEIQAPLKLEADFTAMDAKNLHLPIFSKFLMYQYKAFSALFGITKIDNQSSNQHSTSVFLKIETI